MRGYVVRRVLAIIPVVVVVALIVFSLIHIVPGDPAALMLGEDEATPEEIEELRHKLGLDRPIYEQGARWVLKALRGDLGDTLFHKRPVVVAVAERLEPTLSIAFLGEALAITIGVGLGVVAAWRSFTLIDRAVMVFSVIGFSTPVFWVAIIFLYLFVVWLGWLPAAGYHNISDGLWRWFQHIILPSLTVGITSSALIARMTRASMLEVLREDYTRTARAKGLPESLVLVRHALRNAFNPILTVIGLSFAGLVTGLVITESIFAIPGVGLLVVNSLFRRDFPAIQGVILFVALGYALVNLIVDILYGYFDPKIRY